MGFKKKDQITEIKITLAYRMHVDDKGEPIRFGFVFRNVRDGEAQEAKVEQALAQKPELEQFAELLLDIEGFDDFPLTDNTLAAQVREYFSDDDLAYFYKDALTAYWGTVYPVRLFR